MFHSLWVAAHKGLVALSTALGAGQAPPPVVPPTAPAPIITPTAAIVPAPPVDPPKPGPAARQLYRLADASGQVWTHEDPVWLQRYVLGLNQRFVSSAPAFPYLPRLVPCAGGRCPR